VTARERNESPFGVAMHRQLKLIHQMLRNDLTVCRDLAADVAAGATAADVVDRLAELQANSPIWNLQINCLYHCRIVHMHHHHEDVDMFPALRRSNPDLGVVVDRLESDHRAISVLLDNVESLARKLDDATTSDERDALAFEEENIAATMRSWVTWPG
jgi:Hemerythrin HHE cation binding domain